MIISLMIYTCTFIINKFPLAVIKIHKIEVQSIIRNFSLIYNKLVTIELLDMMCYRPEDINTLVLLGEVNNGI